MNDKELVVKIADLQFELVKHVEKHTNLRCLTHRDFDRIITANKLTCTYGLAVKNLYNNVVKFMPRQGFNTKLLDEVVKIKQEVENSSIKNLRFGLQPERKFSEKERELGTIMLRHQLKLLIHYNN